MASNMTRVNRGTDGMGNKYTVQSGEFDVSIVDGDITLVMYPNDADAVSHYVLFAKALKESSPQTFTIRNQGSLVGDIQVTAISAVTGVSDTGELTVTGTVTNNDIASTSVGNTYEVLW